MVFVVMWMGGWALAETPPDDVLAALDAEMARTMAGWQGAPNAPYFLGYRVMEEEEQQVSARYGQVERRTESKTRMLDVRARVGDYARDSTHELKGNFVAGVNRQWGTALPIDGGSLALQAVVWDATQREIRDAQEKWLRVQANQLVKVKDEDASADFAKLEPPSVDLGPATALDLDLEAWQPTLIELSEILDDHPDVLESRATLRGVAQTETIVTSEGTRVREGLRRIRVAITASTVAPDGADLRLYRWKEVHDTQRLPERRDLVAWANELRDDLIEVRDAKDGQPYSGPVLLRGRAAGVFIHEVLGHRAEGHRQKSEDEGHTFKDKVGELVMPRTITIYDDPTLVSYAGEDLNGHYRYDQQGVPAQRATIVDRGVFQGFLMSRSPIKGFNRSNGHGRAQPGRAPISRMASTIVETTDPKSEATLRQMFRAELKRQGRPFGVLVDEINGGFTMTGRVFPNAFNVRAVTAFKVFADGRPDERIRGIDLVGTPLVALANVMAVGDDPAVFNGYCGAKSGFIPNSAVSPSLLVRTLEVQKKEKGAERPPLLAKPAPSTQGDEA
ncbi:MAG: TldD/PmbA family protein [Myxococcota bacterium]